ncbi:MAG: serine hydrolase [Holophagales bacterium]|nr:serine hydrolase [Holophagales bacterium]
MGARSVPALSTALGDTRESVRQGAAIALGKLGREALPAVPALVGALSDPKENVRWCAVNALGAVGDAATAAVPALREALHDADEDVRRGAALALGRIDPAGWVRAPSWESTVAAIERLTPLLMGELHVPGVSIALVRDRKVAWTRSWGVADARTGAPVTGETLFEAASMTKPVFAFSVLKLVEQGRIDLDRPLAEYVAPPAVPFQEERLRITPRMVLSHTSGLPNWRKGGEERDGPLPVLFAPGSRFGYSGEAIFQLQRAVEKVTGEPIEEHARRTLFAPLGMAAPRTSGRRSSTPGSRAGTRRTGRSSPGRATPTRTPPTRSSRRPRTTRGSSSRSSTRRAPRRTGSLAPRSRRCFATRSASTCGSRSSGPDGPGGRMSSGGSAGP